MESESTFLYTDQVASRTLLSEIVVKEGRRILLRWSDAGQNLTKKSQPGQNLAVKKKKNNTIFFVERSLWTA